METIQYPTETKARKIHKCNLCLTQINEGDIYFLSYYKSDVIYAWRTHAYCSEILELLNMYQESIEGVTSDDFFEYINIEYNNLMVGVKDSKPFKYKLFFVLTHYNIKHK